MNAISLALAALALAPAPPLTHSDLHPLLDPGSPSLYASTCGNGLPALVESRPGTGTVYLRITVRAGSRDEPPGREGIAHLVEHLLFKEGHGAGQRANEAFSRLRAAGALVNASTAFEETEFHAEVPAERFLEGWHALASLVTAPAREGVAAFFADTEVNRERKVVLQELALARSDPMAIAAWTVLRDLFPGDPIGQPVIGTRRSLRSIGPRDLRAFYEEHYWPARMFVVIVGEVDPAAARDRVCASLGSLPPGRARSGYLEPVPRAQPLFRFRTVTDQAYLLAGALTGGEAASDAPALSLIASILGEGRGSRLHRRFVQQEGRASEVLAMAYQVSNAGAFGVGLAVEPEQAAPAMEALRLELHRLSVEPVLPRELEMARVKQAARLALEMQTNEGAAAFRSRRLLTGRTPSRSDALRELESLTPEDLRAAAAARWGESAGGSIGIEVLPARGPGKLLAALRYLLFRRL